MKKSTSLATKVILTATFATAASAALASAENFHEQIKDSVQGELEAHVDGPCTSSWGGHGLIG